MTETTSPWARHIIINTRFRSLWALISFRWYNVDFDKQKCTHRYYNIMSVWPRLRCLRTVENCICIMGVLLQYFCTAIFTRISVNYHQQQPSTLYWTQQSIHLYSPLSKYYNINIYICTYCTYIFINRVVKTKCVYFLLSPGHWYTW